MSKAKIASKSPTVLTLEPGTYAWCTCGESANQPYCDGAHKGSDFKPHVFTLDESKKVALCNCKQTANGPFCDGAHAELD